MTRNPHSLSNLWKNTKKTTQSSKEKTMQPPIPFIWPEENPPIDAANCQKCELATQRSRVIWGEGNPHAPIMVILDNPGARENKEGRPFVCGTRETLQLAASQVNLEIEDLYVTYILKCRPIRAYNKHAARTTCLAHLSRQIEVKTPKMAFCLGNVALQSFLKNPEAEVKTFRGTWRTVNGLPTTASYHPLAVRRRPNLLKIFIEDWKFVADHYRLLTD
jgi:uracil-DNA glycosylase family 4